LIIGLVVTSFIVKLVLESPDGFLIVLFLNSLNVGKLPFFRQPYTGTDVTVLFKTVGGSLIFSLETTEITGAEF
jgi:hypothetical protein